MIKMSEPYIFQEIEKIPEKQVALILGAKVFPDGSMSDILTDRAETALELFQQKKVQKILISGDHSKKNYDEVNTIKNYLLQHGIPPQSIFLDHAGLDTYDSLYRAKEIFQISSAIVVSQSFHLPRAIYIGKSLNLDVVGIVADKHQYVLETYNQFRESVAGIKAFLDINFHSKPKFLGNPIPITGDSKLSWDQT